jgi:hypothetical protein
MNLYTIDATIEEVIEKGCSVDENGEFYEFDDLRELEIKREDKINNTVYFLKNTEAMIKALKDEEKILADRRKILENKASRVKMFLNRFLEVGKKLETPRFKIGWRKSETVEIIDSSFLSSEYAKRETTIKPDKKAIKQALKAGKNINGVELKTNNNLQIK